MRPVLIVLAALAVVAGCTTMTPQERRAIDEAECRDYGFRAGSDAFAECLQRLDLDRRAAMRASAARLDRMTTPAVVYRPVYVPVRYN